MKSQESDGLFNNGTIYGQKGPNIAQPPLFYTCGWHESREIYIIVLMFSITSQSCSFTNTTTVFSLP